MNQSTIHLVHNPQNNGLTYRHSMANLHSNYPTHISAEKPLENSPNVYVTESPHLQYKHHTPYENDDKDKYGV